MKNKCAKMLHSIVRHPLFIISVLLQIIAWILKYIAHKLNMASDKWGYFLGKKFKLNSKNYGKFIKENRKRTCSAKQT